MNSRRSSLLRFDPRFFFEPGHLCRQFANFCIELVELLFVARFEYCQCILFFKEAGQAGYGCAFPLVQLGRMHLILRSELCNRLVFLQQLLHHLGFECGGIVFSHVPNCILQPPLFLSRFMDPLYLSLCD